MKLLSVRLLSCERRCIHKGR